MKTISIIILFLTTSFLYSQLPAFPNAYGAGAYITGGRGQTVYHVTNLNNSGTGSFRQALFDANSNNGGTIVFDVSGVIMLTSLLSADGLSNVTIAGQTAPDGGITVDGERIYALDWNNVIVRYIRFKGGMYADYQPHSGDEAGNDSFSAVHNVTNQIYDHCSFGFGGDESASFYGTLGDNYVIENITVQRCLFAESDKGTIFGAELGGNASFNSNLFYNAGYRVPNTTSGANPLDVDVINNVIIQSSGRLISNYGQNNVNQINNYIDYGSIQLRDVSVNLHRYATGVPQIYTEGNKIIATNLGTLTSTLSEMNADNKLSWKFDSVGGGGYSYGDQLPANYFANTPFNLQGRALTILTADEAFNDVVNDVGCNKRLNADGSVSNNLDVHDTQSLNDIITDNFQPVITGSNKVPSPITSVSRAGGYYSTNAHIPETWGQANVPSFNANSHTTVAPSGYTYLEEFLNQVDTYSQIGDSPVITLIGNAIINLNNGDTYTELGATANDTEDGNISGNIIITGTVNTNVDGVYYKYYNVTDSDGNAASQVTRTINVTTPSNEIPVITLIGDTIINLNNGDVYNELGATAFDTEDGDITNSIIIGGDTVNTNIDGTYIITYNVTDSDLNNAIEVTRTVNVTTPPANTEYDLKILEKIRSKKTIIKLISTHR